MAVSSWRVIRKQTEAGLRQRVHPAATVTRSEFRRPVGQRWHFSKHEFYERRAIIQTGFIERRCGFECSSGCRWLLIDAQIAGLGESDSDGESQNRHAGLALAENRN